MEISHFVHREIVLFSSWQKRLGAPRYLPEEKSILLGVNLALEQNVVTQPDQLVLEDKGSAKAPNKARAGVGVFQQGQNGCVNNGGHPKYLDSAGCPFHQDPLAGPELKFQFVFLPGSYSHRGCSLPLS